MAGQTKGTTESAVKSRKNLIFVALVIWAGVTAFGANRELNEGREIALSECRAGSVSSRTNVDLTCRCFADQLVSGMFVTEWIDRMTIRVFSLSTSRLDNRSDVERILRSCYRVR